MTALSFVERITRCPLTICQALQGSRLRGRLKSRPDVHEQKGVPGTGAERLVIKGDQVGHHTANLFLFLLEDVTAALRQQELAQVNLPNTLGFGALWMTIRLPAARGPGSEIKGNSSGVRTPGFFQVREEMVFLDGSTECPRLKFF